MAPDDDPEKRIRELERSMADAANASELGTTGQSSQPGQYYPPPPAQGYDIPQYPGTQYPGTQYPGAQFPGAPFPTTAPKPSQGMRVGWIVLGLLIVGLVVGGTAVFANQMVSTTRSLTNLPTTPRISGGGGQFTTSHGAPTPEPPVAPPSTSAATVSEAPTGGTISVAGVGETRTIACNDSNVSVSGVSNHVVLTGHCAEIDVSGVENTVTVDAADAITASGMNNRVTFHGGSPDINQSGIANSVEQG